MCVKMGETVRKWQGEKYSLSFPECTKNTNYTSKNPKIPKEEVQKKVSNFHESLTLSRPASSSCTLCTNILLCKVSFSITKLKRQDLGLTLPVRGKTGSVSLPAGPL